MALRAEELPSAARERAPAMPTRHQGGALAVRRGFFRGQVTGREFPELPGGPASRFEFKE